MKALIIGATGATGKDLVTQLLADDTYSEVHSFVRRAPSSAHPKLKSHVVDFEQPDTWAELLRGDIAFSCLGTTLAQAGSEEAQWRVDYDYQWQFAERCRKNGVSVFVLVSAAGADAKSSMFYNKMKGKLEDAVKTLNFPKLLIFQPSLLIRGHSDRTGENISMKVINFLNKIGLFKRYKPMPTSVLAEKMIKAAKDTKQGTHTFTLNKIFEI